MPLSEQIEDEFIAFLKHGKPLPKHDDHSATDDDEGSTMAPAQTIPSPTVACECSYYLRHSMVGFR